MLRVSPCAIPCGYKPLFSIYLIKSNCSLYFCQILICVGSDTASQISGHTSATLIAFFAAFDYVARQLGASTDECKFYHPALQVFPSCAVAIQSAQKLLFSKVKPLDSGVLISTVKLIFSFLLSYPLAGLLKRFPDEKPWQKNVFVIGQVIATVSWNVL